MSNFSFKADTPYRYIPSMEIDLFNPRIVLSEDTTSRDTGAEEKWVNDLLKVPSQRPSPQGRKLETELSAL